MATVMKAKDFERFESGAHHFSLKDVEAEAAQILSAARAEAEAIIAASREAAERIKEEAHEQGSREGREEGVIGGREAGRSEAKAQALADYVEKAGLLTDTFQAALDELNDKKKQFLASAEEDLLVLALEIAGRVVKRTGRFDRSAAVENLKEVIHRVGKKSSVQVWVHPADMASVELFAKEFASAQEGWGHIDVMADETISPGGCRLKMPEGQVDATLETQLEHIGALLVPAEKDQA